MLTFDEAAHRYFWNGQPVPGVTSVLAPLTDYSRIPAATLERARQEGIAIHKTVELYCKDDLDEDSLPDWLRPRLEAFKKFVAETGFTLIASESQVFHPTYRYAGTFDLHGEMRVGKRGRDPLVRNSLIDIKRSFAAGAGIGYQLAAYQEAKRATAPDIAPKYRFALRLLDDGTYRLEEFAKADDFANFLTCLNFRRLMEKHHGNRNT